MSAMTPPAPTPEQPKHRADVPVDCCSRMFAPFDVDCTPPCLSQWGLARHAAARVAEDERRAL